MANLTEVLRRMGTAGRQHRFPSQHPACARKVCAICDAPAPQNIHQLKSFLGLINFHAKLFQNLSTNLAPLYSLVQNHRPWSWRPDQERTFQKAKTQLLLSNLLAYYCDQKDFLQAYDASPYGVGGVLSHPMQDGSDNLIAYASCTLAAAEHRYSQLDKEGLAIISGITKF